MCCSSTQSDKLSRSLTNTRRAQNLCRPYLPYTWEALLHFLTLRESLSTFHKSKVWSQKCTVTFGRMPHSKYIFLQVPCTSRTFLPRYSTSRNSTLSCTCMCRRVELQRIFHHSCSFISVMKHISYNLGPKVHFAESSPKEHL